MPMPQGVPGGGLPPPSNIGAATIPQGSPGQSKQATELIDIAHKALAEAIPKIPLGSKIHAKVMKITLELDKLKSEVGEEIQSSTQQLIQLMQTMKSQQGMQTLNSVSPPPQQPPAMPPPAPPPAGM
jgi:hypothetical protein